MKRFTLTALIGIVVMGICIETYANGYKILNVKSAKATGMAEAFIVQADDPSAIAMNPAGLAQLSGNQLNVHATICNAYARHRSPSGQKTDIEDKWQMVPSVFWTTDMGREDMSAGLGISFPNGISTEWAQDSFARYVATYSDLIVADICPAFGMRLNDFIMLGAGLDLIYSEAQLENIVDAGVLGGGAPNGMDLESKLKGDGTALSANIGIICEINSRHSAAVTYRHGFSVDYEGDITLGGVRSDVEATLDFPASVVLGYAYKPTEQLKLEVDLDWTDWQAVDDIVIDIAGAGRVTQQQDFHNTIAWKFGAEYAWTDALDLRLGYIYNENATPEHAWRPSLPDTDVHFLTMGAGYDVNEATTIDTALQLVYYEKRTIDNNVDFNEFASMSSIDGTYRNFAPCLSISATRRF